jgi:hypothetical protein
MGETETKEVSGCSDVPMPSVMPCCDYVRPSIATIKARQDPDGNWLIQINDDGVWRGSTLLEDKNTLQFFY